MFKRPTAALQRSPKLAIIWHRDKLLLSNTGESVLLNAKSNSEWIAPLAMAAKQLLLKQRHKSVSLYLAGQYFIGSYLSLPGIPVAALNNAIQLQLDTILPGQEQDLLATVAQVTEPDNQYLIMCFAKSMADELYTAFEKQGLQLQLILPRTLAALNKRDNCCQILDQDEQGQTLIQWQQGRMSQWAYIHHADLADNNFAQEWQDLQDQHPENCRQQVLQHFADWKNKKQPPNSLRQYAFVAPLAIKHQAHQNHRKKRFGIYALLGLLLLTFIGTSLALWRYEKRIKDELKILNNVTADIRQLRDHVFTIENRLAAIDNFPDQKIKELLGHLNGLIPPHSWLIQFNIKKGILTLEGYSPNPTKLLNALAQHPQFSEVAFNKPISSGTGAGKTDRFGISLKINGVDVEGYVQTYYLQGE